MTACSGVVFMSAHVCWQVTLGKVLKVIVVMRSLFIDRTIVKGYSENVYTEDGKVGGRAATGLPSVWSGPGPMWRSSHTRRGRGDRTRPCPRGGGAAQPPRPPQAPVLAETLG